MKRITTIVAVFVFALSLISAVDSQAANNDSFNKNLVKALKSDNQGLQVSALQLVVKYGKDIDIKDATLDVVRIYRRSNNEQFRQLALAAINASQNEWAIGVVARDYQFETNPKIKKMMAAVLSANGKTSGSQVSAQ
jgi:hypothetical protein